VKFFAEEREEMCEIQFLGTLGEHLLDQLGVRFTPYNASVPLQRQPFHALLHSLHCYMITCALSVDSMDDSILSFWRSVTLICGALEEHLLTYLPL